MKYIQTGHIDRYKTRLIVRDFNQMQNIDYENFFSSTLRLESLRMLLAFTANFEYEIKQMNVSNAYLKEKLKEIIYMKISEGYQLSENQQADQSNIRKRDQVLRLLRPLYELKQFGREWNLKAKNHLITMRFRPIVELKHTRFSSY